MNKLQAGLVAVVALVIGVYVAINIAPPSVAKLQHVKMYPQPRALPELQLVDQTNNAFTKAELTGKWSLLFVGYTYCPDICPTTLAELHSIYPELQQIPTEHPIQVVFLSVDPKRDTPQRLNEYINFFNPEFKAVSGEHAQLFPFVRSMGMMYSMSESTDKPDYLVDHSASVVLINPQAQVIGRFKPEFEVGKLPVSEGRQILADLPIIIAQ